MSSYTSLIREYYPQANILESLGIAGVDIRNESSKTKVADWLKRIGLDRETTGISETRSTIPNDTAEYALSGIRTAGGKGIVIRNNKKYVRQ